MERGAFMAALFALTVLTVSTIGVFICMVVGPGAVMLLPEG